MSIFTIIPTDKPSHLKVVHFRISYLGGRKQSLSALIYSEVQNQFLAEETQLRFYNEFRLQHLKDN